MNPFAKKHSEVLQLLTTWFTLIHLKYSSIWSNIWCNIKSIRLKITKNTLKSILKLYIHKTNKQHFPFMNRSIIWYKNYDSVPFQIFYVIIAMYCFVINFFQIFLWLIFLRYATPTYKDSIFFEFKKNGILIM